MIDALTRLRVAVVVAIAVASCLWLAAGAGAYVYWASGATGNIGRANLDGSGSSPNFIGGATDAIGLAVDGQHVYWANNTTDTIGRANLDGSGVNQAFIVGANSPKGVAVDGQHIYWSNGCCSIARANLDGSAVNLNLISGATAPITSKIGVAVDGQHLYWANFTSEGGKNGTTIGRANLDGSGVNQNFIAGASEPYGVAVDGQHVYWTNRGSETVGRANLDGSGADQNLIGGASGIFGLAVDNQHLYWANGSAVASSIGEANLDGSGVNQSLIGGAGGPVGVAVDSLLPPNAFNLLGKQLKKKNGTAVLIVSVPGPGRLALAGRGIRKQSKDASGAGTVKLTVRAAGREEAQAEHDWRGEGEGDAYLHADRGPPEQHDEDDQARQAPRRLTLNVRIAGVGSMLPAASIARTLNACFLRCPVALIR